MIPYRIVIQTDFVADGRRDYSEEEVKEVLSRLATLINFATAIYTNNPQPFLDIDFKILKGAQSALKSTHH